MNICKTCKTIKRNMKIDDIVVSTDHKPLDPKTGGSPNSGFHPTKSILHLKKFNRDLTVDLGKSLVDAEFSMLSLTKEKSQKIR